MMNGFGGRLGPQAMFRGSPGPYQPGVGAPMGSGGGMPSAMGSGGPPMAGSGMPGGMPSGMDGGAPGGGAMGLAQAIQDWKARRGGGSPMPMMGM